MRRKIFFFLLLVVVKVGYGFNLRIAPTGFAEQLDRPVSRIVYVYNETKQPMRVMVGIESFSEGEEYSLEDNIKVFPKVLTIPPKGKRTARFRIDPTGLEDGEYRSYLYFKEMSKEKTREDINKELEKGEMSIKINMLTNMGIAIYGYVGEIVPGVEIVEDTISKQNEKWILNVVGKTTGNCSMTVVADIKYLDVDGDEIGVENVSDRVARGEEGAMRMTLLNTPIETKRIEIDYKDKKGNLLKSVKYSLES